MPQHPFSGVAIAAVHNTRQARVMEGHTSLSLACEAALGVLDAAGLDRRDIDGIAGGHADALTYLLGIGPTWTLALPGGIPLLGAVVNAVAAGVAETVLIVNAVAGVYSDRSSTAPWTRPEYEFTTPAGLFTASQFALVAQRHMKTYGTTPEQLATVAATIRNNGHVNPEAVYFGRGPYKPEDILASRMVAEPFHLLDCCMNSEGGCALIVTTAERAEDLRPPPVYLLGYGDDRMGPGYRNPSSWDLRSTVDSDAIPMGLIGRRAARRAFAMAGLSPADVDVCEFYDNFSFEVIRAFEAFGFCEVGEGGDFVMDGTIEPGGRYPISTDGGLLSFSHAEVPQALQRVIRGVQQLQRTCATNQIADAEVVLSSTAGSAALGVSTVLLGRERP